MPKAPSAAPEQPTRTRGQQSHAIGYVRFAAAARFMSRAAMTSQHDRIERYATIHGLELLDIIGVNGETGMTSDPTLRPSLARLYGTVRASGATTVIVTDHSHIARNVHAYNQIMHELAKHGARILTVSDASDQNPHEPKELP